MDREKLTLYVKDINNFYLAKKRMPSYSEMLDMFGLRSKNAVFKRISSLVKAKLLEKDPRGRLLPKRVLNPLHILGAVRAGFPSPAEEELQDVISLDEYLISDPGSTFLLKVDGDSMIEAGIHPDDLVLVQRNITPKPGDIVVAHVDNEWTIKYFDKKGKQIILRPANKKYPSVKPFNELSIAGVIIANVRKYK